MYLWHYINQYNFTIPKTTPPGHYLLRFEHVFPNQVDAQFYMNCAHVEILNSDGDVGTPGPLVKIPSVYERGQRGMSGFSRREASEESNNR